MRTPDPALVEALGHLLAMRHVGEAEAGTWEVLRAELEQVGFSVGAVRRLQEAAVVLRKNGTAAIGLSGRGVFIAQTVDELDAAIAEKAQRAKAAFYDLRTLKRIRRTMLGQQPIPEAA
jgi:hypothetical protein